jgi:MFS family permease
MTLTRDILRIVLSVLIGPLIGGIAFFAGADLYETAVAHVPPVFAHPDPTHLIGPLIFFSFFMGLIPALLSGIVTTIIAHRTHSRRRRLLYSAIAGAILSGVLVGWVVVTGDTSIAPPPVFITIAALSGGLAALIVVLIVEQVGRRHHRHVAPPPDAG